MVRVTERSAGTESFGIPVDDLYRRYAPDALRVARSITHNRDDAADAVAEAFTRVLQAMSTGREVEPRAFRPYLLAATRNASIDVLRRAGRLTPTDRSSTFDGPASGAGPSDRLLAGEDRTLVSEAFAGLPARWRAVLWLTEVEGLAPRDAAPLLHLTPNNVSQLAVRARARLRQDYIQLHVRNHAAGDCIETTEHLGGLVAGELTAIQAKRVQGHLAECVACRARLAELDDLGLCLRRAAAPLPLALLRRRLRWRRRPARTYRSRRPAAWLASVDPSAPASVLALGSSPAAQQVAAAVAAGLLALGVGAVVVRHHDARRPEPAPAAVALADPGAAGRSEGTPAAPGAAPVLPDALASTTTTVAVPPSTILTSTAAPAVRPAPFTPRGPLASASPSYVAQAVGPQVVVYDGPGTGAPVRAFNNPQPSGAPLVLLVTDQRPGWLQVLLPVRPNGSTGWIRTDQVSVASHAFRIVVELGAHRITAYNGTQVLLSEPVGVGTAAAPTPGGLYYVKELFQPVDVAGRPDPGGPYGPYAYGLSGFSDVLYDFAGGDGQFGIHGTNDPAGLGLDVSHGCIRMSNTGITYLARALPLGVPVEIVP